MKRSATAAIIVASLLVTIAVTSPIAKAQATGATISGTVRDATGATISEAHIEVTNTATNGILSVASNSSGEFRAPFLPPGLYNLAVTKPGFKQFIRVGLELRVAEVVDVPVVLEIGQVNESLSVRAESPLLAASEASHASVLDRTRISELPVRDGSSAELVVLAPGVVNTTNLRPRKAAFTGGLSQLIANGGQQYGNEFTLDGIANMAASSSGNRIAYSPPLEAMEELKIQTSTYDAGQGHSPSAVFNMVTRGGTNEFHGEAHEWLKNKVLDANDFFNNMSGVPRSNYKDNRFGFSLGGPLYLPKVYNGRNKTFWFFAWEDNPFDQVSVNILTTPTEAQRRGDFSGLLALGPEYQIYDPFSTVATGSGHVVRNPFPGNVMPTSLIAASPSVAAVQSLFKYWSTPNRPASTTNGRNNYISPTPLQSTHYRTYALRIDQNISEKHRLFGRISWDYWLEDARNLWGNIANGSYNIRRNRLLALDDVYVLSPNLVLNTRLGITRSPQAALMRSTGKVDYKGLGFSDVLANLIPKNLQSFPTITASGYDGLGGGSYNFNNNDIRSLSGTLSWQKTRHSIRFGGEFRDYLLNNRNAPTAVSPQIGFGNSWITASDTATSPPLGGAIASLLLGLPQSGSMAVVNGYSVSNTWWGFFLHDDWKVSSKLTLNIGLRYELENPETERYNRMVGGFDAEAALTMAPQALAAYAAQPIPEIPVNQFKVQGGYIFLSSSHRQLWARNNLNIMPRFGLAYRLGNKTVLRSGYGIFFDNLGIGRSLVNQTGFSRTTSLVGSLDLGQTYLSSLVNPFPTGLLPPVGGSLGANQDLGLSITIPYLIPRTPYNQNWSFGFQRELPGKFVLDAAYVGNRGVALPISQNLNFIPRQYLSTSPLRDQANLDFLSAQTPNPFAGLLPGTGLNGSTVARQQLLVAYPQFPVDGVTATVTAGSSWYHSLQVSFERRYSNGLTISGGLTWSKAMDATGYLNPSDTKPEHVISEFDPGHTFNVNGVYELPFGKGRRFGGSWHGVTDHVLGGWRIASMFRAQGGPPAFIDNSVLLPGHSIAEAANPNTRSWQEWFNYAAFDTNINDQPQSNNIRTLSSRFASLRGPGYWLLDVSLNKTFTIHEHFQAQLRGEAYNIPNHVNLNQYPGFTPSQPGSSQITSTNGPSPRTIQLALKVMF